MIRAIPEKNTWGGGGGGGGGGGDRIIDVRPNLITWMVGVSLLAWGRKNIICQKKREVLSNLAKKRSEHSKQQRKPPFLFMPNRQNSDVSLE